MNVEFISLARQDFLNVFTSASHSCKYKKNLVSLVKYIQYSTILYKYTVKIEYTDLHHHGVHNPSWDFPAELGCFLSSAGKPRVVAIASYVKENTRRQVLTGPGF